MRVLDLFSGLGGWSAAFRDRGHDVVTVDIVPEFMPTICSDLMLLTFTDLGGPWDIILASPPCEGWSVMNIGKNWTHDHQPKTEKAKWSMAIVQHTLSLIRDLSPRAFIIENPRAKLRKMPFMQQFERRTVTYCKLGEKRMKPTDLWGGFPPTLELPPPCKNGDDCHIRAPRGSTTGTQGMSAPEAAKIPYRLSSLICDAMEGW